MEFANLNLTDVYYMRAYWSVYIHLHNFLKNDLNFDILIELHDGPGHI